MSEGPREGEGGNIVQRITAAFHKNHKKTAATAAAAASLAACEPAPQDNRADSVAPDAVPAEVQTEEAHKVFREVLSARLKNISTRIRKLLEDVNSGRFLDDPYGKHLQSIEIALNDAASLAKNGSGEDLTLFLDALDKVEKTATTRPVGSVLENDTEIFSYVDGLRTEALQTAIDMRAEIAAKKK